MHESRHCKFGVNGPGSYMSDRSTILVVDDDAAHLESLAALLEAVGFNPVPATSGSEALQLMKAFQPFFVVLSDIQMPGMDGLELAERLSTAAPGVPVLLMTGHSDPVAWRKVHERALIVLDKPLDIDQLLDTLRSLDRRQ